MAEDELVVAQEQHEESAPEVKEEASTGEIHPFDPMKKKKKKKVRAEDAVELETSDKVAEKVEILPLPSTAGDGLDSSLAGLKKKKKKKPVSTRNTNLTSKTFMGLGGTPIVDGELEGENGDETAETNGEKVTEEDVEEEGEGIILEAQFPWEGLDRDYKYDELLGRVFNILRENNPELAGEKRRTVMRPPQVLREGTKKTVFVNFMDLCKTMHRQPQHVMDFLLAELGTNGSLDGQQRLVVKGRFAPKNFEGILRRYVNEYVMCNGCKSPDTILSKENRLFFLRCEQCGSYRSVAQIKAGFVARVGRRKATT